MCDAAPFTPELCHLDELKHVNTDNIGRSASPSRQAHETTDLGVTSTTSTVAHCSPGALTSRERTPSPCLQDTSASSIASVSPEFPPHWVSFVGQGRHTQHHVRALFIGLTAQAQTLHIIQSLLSSGQDLCGRSASARRTRCDFWYTLCFTCWTQIHIDQRTLRLTEGAARCARLRSWRCHRIRCGVFVCAALCLCCATTQQGGPREAAAHFVGFDLVQHVRPCSSLQPTGHRHGSLMCMWDVGCASLPGILQKRTFASAGGA